MKRTLYLLSTLFLLFGFTSNLSLAQSNVQIYENEDVYLDDDFTGHINYECDVPDMEEYYCEFGSYWHDGKVFYEYATAIKNINGVSEEGSRDGSIEVFFGVRDIYESSDFHILNYNVYLLKSYEDIEDKDYLYYSHMKFDVENEESFSETILIPNLDIHDEYYIVTELNESIFYPVAEIGPIEIETNIEESNSKNDGEFNVWYLLVFLGIILLLWIIYFVLNKSLKNKSK